MTRTPSPVNLPRMAQKRKSDSPRTRPAKGPSPRKKQVKAGKTSGKPQAKGPPSAPVRVIKIIDPALVEASGLGKVGKEEATKELNTKLTRGRGKPPGTGPKRRGETAGFYLDLDVSAWAKGQGSVVINQILRAAMGLPKEQLTRLLSGHAPTDK